MKSIYKKLNVRNSLEALKAPDKKIKSYHYGLALLKSYLAFLVVVTHQFSRKSTKNTLILRITNDTSYHVPCFFVLSFYFSFKNLISFNKEKIINRFIRLLIPYIGWPFIILLINKIYNLKLGKKLPDTYEALKAQLIWGSGYIGQFWFQWNLIVSTLFFVIIMFVFRKNFQFILILIIILFYYIQYSGNNLAKYLNLKKNDIFTVGRIFEMIPLGVTGLTLGHYDIINKLHTFKFQSFTVSLLIYNFIQDYKVFSNIRGFYYQGIELNIKAICLVFIFSLFPSDRIQNKYLIKIFDLITRYSAGPFYLHISIRAYLFDYNDNIKKGTFLGIIINYLICYIISILGYKIFGKSLLRHLFC